MLAYIDALAAVDGLLARRVVLEHHLAQIAHSPELWPIVARLRAFRGVDTLTALGLHCEIGDWHRFARPRQLSSWLGLVPSIDQSRREHHPWPHHQDRLPARPPAAGRSRLALPAPPRVGATLRNRHDGQPAEILAIAWRAQHRLVPHPHPAPRARQARQPRNVAAARELAGFLWAAATT